MKMDDKMISFLIFCLPTNLSKTNWSQSFLAIVSFELFIEIDFINLIDPVVMTNIMWMIRLNFKKLNTRIEETEKNQIRFINLSDLAITQSKM